jgi:hypothetical protein
MATRRRQGAAQVQSVGAGTGRRRKKEGRKKKKRLHVGPIAYFGICLFTVLVYRF